ncbi:4'-phosphopantetheinyl transferase family protein [Nocardia brasiliensis]|uniref:4'-phosphopantetheinyl transferase family protein n=1 Tax=Nocardia brasiliensis TaxID=37326 RepID=UPI002454B9A3|nr:4'-phosphopantetheinyl transferase superfamily protein [Nocardia brasiliensis]
MPDGVAVIGGTAARRTIAPDDVELWWTALTGECAPQDRRVLDAAELDRSTRFGTAGFANDFIRIRATLRRVLAAYTGIAPETLEFTAGVHGKPELPGHALQFNLTHTTDCAVVAVAGSGAVGVDIESLDTDFDQVALAARVLTRAEADLVRADRRRFLHHWVAKESYLKWLGSGLTISPDTLEVGADASGRTVVTGVDGVELPVGYVHRFGSSPRHVGAFVSHRPARRFPLRPAESAGARAYFGRRSAGVQA